jgi:hypothetical protein
LVASIPILENRGSCRSLPLIRSARSQQARSETRDSNSIVLTPPLGTASLDLNMRMKAEVADGGLVDEPVPYHMYTRVAQLIIKASL